jgi:hypothetical protein
MVVHGRPLVYLRDDFQGWRAAAQSTTRPDGVVVFPALFDGDLLFLQGATKSRHSKVRP